MIMTGNELFLSLDCGIIACSNIHTVTDKRMTLPFGITHALPQSPSFSVYKTTPVAISWGTSLIP